MCVITNQTEMRPCIILHHIIDWAHIVQIHNLYNQIVRIAPWQQYYSPYLQQ